MSIQYVSMYYESGQNKTNCDSITYELFTKNIVLFIHMMCTQEVNL